MVVYIEGGSLAGCSNCPPPAPHTPGPWSFDYLIEDKPDGTRTSIPAVVTPSATICEIQYDDPYRWQANARLIAAAPDLLAAVKGFKAAFAGFFLKHDPRLPEYERLSVALDAAMRAEEKAVRP